MYPDNVHLTTGEASRIQLAISQVEFIVLLDSESLNVIIDI